MGNKTFKGDLNDVKPLIICGLARPVDLGKDLTGLLASYVDFCEVTGQSLLPNTILHNLSDKACLFGSVTQTRYNEKVFLLPTHVIEKNLTNYKKQPNKSDAIVITKFKTGATQWYIGYKMDNTINKKYYINDYNYFVLEDHYYTHEGIRLPEHGVKFVTLKDAILDVWQRNQVVVEKLKERDRLRNIRKQDGEPECVVM